MQLDLKASCRTCFAVFFLTMVSAVFSMETSYSSVDSLGVPLDQKIIERIGIKNGTFIEVGAFDGIVQSNTKRLEEFHGWTGILVEPSKVLQKRLVRNRPNSKCFQCALGSPEQDNTYLHGDFDGRLMSSIDGNREHKEAKHRVLVRCLQSILDEVEVHHINFFSLDVEGYELNVLKGVDFNKTSFDFILIEVYSCHYDAIVEFLELKGYMQVENLSNYSTKTNPDWDGTHNDYLFQRKQVED